MRNRTLLLILISAVALTVAINAAEEAKPAEILLSAFPLSIPADGKSTSLITATIPEATATTMADTNTVKFTTTLGKIEPAGEIKNGIAQVLLRSGLVPGIAMVTATYRNMTNTINVHFGRKPKFFLYLNRNAQFVPADNSSTVIIEALIASENAFVPDGTVVTFRADHGKVTPLATTMGGRAIAVLTTDTFVGPVKVIAQCESLKADTPSIEFIQPKIKGIRLWTPTLKVPADGISTATVTAFIIGPDNEPLCMPGIPLTFEATEGLIKSVNLFTDIGGSARTVVGPSRVPGKVIVTATSGEFKDSIEVEFIKLKSPALIEMLQGFPVETYGKDYTVCRIVAIVKDKVDNSVGPGVEVKFSASQGFITPLKRTDEKGIAVAHLIFPGTKGTVK
ncbi:MAG: invasin domain 3-containing protein, partial [Halobacteria archaeon]